MEVGPDSLGGTATRYGLVGPGLNPDGGEIFRTYPDQPWRPPSIIYSGHRVFPEVKGTGRGVDHPPHLSPRLKKESLWAFVPCSRVTLRYCMEVSRQVCFLVRDGHWMSLSSLAMVAERNFPSGSKHFPDLMCRSTKCEVTHHATFCTAQDCLDCCFMSIIIYCCGLEDIAGCSLVLNITWAFTLRLKSL